METRRSVAADTSVNINEGSSWEDDAFSGDAEFAKSTLEGMAAFSEGQETISLEELRAEVA